MANDTSQDGGAFPTPADKAAFFLRLEELHRKSKQDGANKNEQAIILIAACIIENITSGSSIIGIISCFELNKRHVGAVLNSSRGDLWGRDKAGNYYLLAPLC